MEFKWSINGFQKVLVCPCMPMYADVCHGHSWHILKTGDAPVSWWLHPHCDWTDSRINKCSSVERVHFLVKIWSCWVCYRFISICMHLSSWYHHLSHKWKGRSVRSEDRYPFQIVVLCGQLAYVFELGVKRCGAKKSDAAFNNFFDKAWHAKVWRVWRRPTHGWQLPTNNDPWAHGPVQRKLEHVGLWNNRERHLYLALKEWCEKARTISCSFYRGNEICQTYANNVSRWTAGLQARHHQPAATPGCLHVNLSNHRLGRRHACGSWCSKGSKFKPPTSTNS